MRLEPRRKLGVYEILALIGAGGMGEVYRARDTKLGRDVAIKVLPEGLAVDRERLARFEREARLLASLNHPNIATLHGLEEHEGLHYLVMELVEGENLAERIARPLPLAELRPIFEQMADALEAAHETGVIHRDLKPANIHVTPDGKVKVLDFGLAKALAPDVPEDDLSHSPTITRHGTETGVILGTAPYMSPEQARGKVVDKRTDLWAFGCCLYEALTGKAAFLGETVTDTIARIVEREPDWSLLPPATPASLRRLLRRCLEKDPARRLRDAGDAKLELQDVSDAAPLARSNRWRNVLPWAAAALLSALVFLWRSPVAVEPELLRATIDLPAAHDEAFLPVLSPDGTRLVYLAADAEGRRLYVRRLDEEASVAIPGTEGAQRSAAPFFSPDGEWVGFFADEKLKKVRLDGGVGAVVLADVPRTRGGDWGPDGNIVFGLLGNKGLMRVSSNGGAPEVLTSLEEGEVSHRRPQVLSGGKTVLFLSLHGSTIDDSRILVQSLETGERRVLGRGSHARYVRTGHLVYGREGTLYAVPFDLDRLEVRGTGAPVETGVWTPRYGMARRADFSVSETGTLVYQPSDTRNRRLYVVDRDGKSTPLPAPPQPYQMARFSPAGERLALTAEGGKVHLYDLEHDRLSLLTSEFEDASGVLWRPIASIAWSPDGRRLALDATMMGEAANFFILDVEGTRAPEPLLEKTRLRVVQGWAPDGTRLVYNEMELDEAVGNPWAIWELPLDSDDAAPRRIVQAPRSAVLEVSLSPDGRWVAYSSNESGRHEIYARRYGEAGGARQISTDGGRYPLWSPGGAEVYYRSGGDIVAVPITTEPRLAAGRPEVLFEWGYEPGFPVHRHFDISPDGRRFVMLQPEAEPPPPHFRIVLNWHEELKRLVPTS